MKKQDLLIMTAFSLMVVGCGDAPTSNESSTQQKLFSHEGEKVYNRIFGDTLKHSSPTDAVRVGTVQPEVKNIIRNIWAGLTKVGFSGYDPKALEEEVTYNPAELKEDKRLSYPSTHPFHTRLIHVMTSRTAWGNIKKSTNESDLYLYTGFLDSLIGLKSNNQIVYDSERLKTEPIRYRGPTTVSIFTLSLSEPDKEPNRAEGSKDEVISKDRLIQWNKIFVDEFKKDSFFKQFFESAALSDGTGTVSLLRSRRGRTGLDSTVFALNGISGSKADLGMPLYVQLKGSLNHGKSTNLTTGAVAYKMGNTVFGAIQSYANAGVGFGLDGRQLETSIVASHNLGSLFIEGQLGSVSATDVRFKDWAATRSQLTLGLDTDWFSPFVQVTLRDFGDKTDTATHAGLDIDLSETKADTYSFSTRLLTKIGHHTVHGATAMLEWSGSLILNSGVSFTSNLAVGTAAEPSAGLTFALNR